MYNKIVIMLLIVLLLSISSVIGFQSFAEGNEEEVIDTTIEVIETVSLANNDTIMIESLEMTLVSENQHLELYVNHMTASFAIVDKKSDQIWFSNPIDRENDTIVSGENKGLLNSQLILSYYNSNGKITRMDSYKDSVLKEQFEIEGINNGFKVTYSFGEAASGLDRIPQRISGERFQTLILDKIEDDRMRVDLERRFKYIEEEEVWERRDASFPVLIMERTIHLLEEIGYTEEDLAIDNADVGGQDAVVEHPYFIVPLVVEIDERELLVSIDTKEVEYNEAFPISTLQVLPFFGAANESKEGYMLVPDGSGALIHLNNEKSNYQPFNAQVYGNDKAVFSREETVVSETIRLPIFGMKQADHAFFAIIEKGDAVASIRADVAGRLNGYNSIHSSFLFKEVGEITLSGGERSSTISIFQKGKFEKDIVIRYGFLQGEDASYSGMAAYYRNYLQEKHDLVPLEPEENIPFYLDLVGSIWKRKTFLGVPYKSLEPITTFEQAQMIIEELQDANIENIKLRYLGWFNDGFDHKIPTKVSVDKEIGGEIGLADLTEFLIENKVDFFPDVAFKTVYRNSLGFSPSRDASRFINRRVGEVYPINPASYRRDRTKSVNYILSPSRLDAYVNSFLADFQSLNINGVSLRDLGNEMNSDFSEKNSVNREESKEIMEEQLKKFANEGNNILTVGGNSIVLPYTDHILHVPLTSSEFNITDRSVPFYQMVIHGYIDYAGTPVNISANQNVNYHLLKALETGSNIYFQWFYEEPSIVKDTEFSYLFSSNYEVWFSDAVEMYQQANEFLNSVRTLPITSHEYLAHGVYKTTYGDDYTVIVNYSNKNVALDGIVIEAEGYKIRQGD